MNHLPIFPTPLEQLRVITQYFDLPIPNKKALDDKVHDKNIRLELMWSYISETWYEPLKTLLSEELVETMNHHFCRYISNYLKIVGNRDVSGISRNELMDILIKYFFPKEVYSFLMNKIPEQYQFPDVTQLFNYKNKSVATVLNWLENDSTWQEYLSQLDTKEDKDKIERWRRGEYLPSFQAIKLLSKEKTHDWVKIKFWLLIARALDEVRKAEYDNVFHCLNLHIHVNQSDINIAHRLNIALDKAITDIQQKNNNLPHLKTNTFSNLYFNLLSLEKSKNNKMKDKALKELNFVRSVAKSENRLEYEVYMWDKLEARWHLFAGNLEKAVELYRKSFEQGLFCAGSNLKSIIHEAAVTTAYFEKSTGNSQRKLLAHLKNAMVMFSYEMPSFEQPSEKLNHKETVADWEVNMWANEFHRFFPRNTYFPNVDYPYLDSQMNGLITFEELAELKPDYKNPNKKINFQSKKMPQIALFTLLHDERNEDLGNRIDIVEQLLLNGADVNQLSSYNESALLIALEKMDLKAIMPIASQDKRLFDLIVQYPHTKETINAKTAKLEKYPLMQAVLTGRPDVVKTIVQMGADVDQINHTNTTPLYQCLTMMCELHKGKLETEEMLNNYLDINFHSEIQQESFRRHHAASSGLGLGAFYSQNKPDFKKKKYQHIWKRLMDTIVKSLFKNYTEYTSMDKLQEIAKILLEAGADPNYPHKGNGMNGYTPLMMAIESNNPVVFELMKQYGGDTSLCVHTPMGLTSCHDIKMRWKSDKIHL